MLAMIECYWKSIMYHHSCLKVVANYELNQWYDASTINISLETYLYEWIQGKYYPFDYTVFCTGVQAYEFQELACFGRNNLWNAQVLLIEFSILALSINHLVA